MAEQQELGVRTAPLTFHSYPDLHAELRLKVISEVLQGWLWARLGDKDEGPSRARFACVNLEWQEEAERYSFKHLTFRAGEIETMEKICVGRRLNIIAEVTLNIGLNDFRELGPVYRDISSTHGVPKATDLVQDSLCRTLNIFKDCKMSERLRGQPLDFAMTINVSRFLRSVLLPRPHLDVALPLSFHSLQTVEVVGRICLNKMTVDVEKSKVNIAPLSLISLLERLPGTTDLTYDLPQILPENLDESRKAIMSLPKTHPHLAQLKIEYPDGSKVFDPEASVFQHFMPLSHQITELALTCFTDVSAFMALSVTESAHRGFPCWPVLNRLTLRGPNWTGDLSDESYAQFRLDGVVAFTAAVPSMPALRFTRLQPFTRPSYDDPLLPCVTLDLRSNTWSYPYVRGAHVRFQIQVAFYKHIGGEDDIAEMRDAVEKTHGIRPRIIWRTPGGAPYDWKIWGSLDDCMPLLEDEYFFDDESSSNSDDFPCVICYSDRESSSDDGSSSSDDGSSSDDDSSSEEQDSSN